MNKNNPFSHEKRTVNGFIRYMVVMFVLMFGGVISYLLWFTVKEAPDIINSPYNGRMEKLNETYTRGDILSADGKILATSIEGEKGAVVRSYPFSNAFAQIVGYTTVGESGLESSAGYYLLNSHDSMMEIFLRDLRNEKVTGDNVITTLDSGLQTLVHDAMEGYEGACVVMDAASGAVLASVSLPDFDPNTIKEDYEAIVSDKTNTNLLNRVDRGLYSPGSTFKLVTALAYIREHPDDWQDFEYNCTGSIKVDGNVVKCSHGKKHGKVNLTEALAESCNGAFITMGLSLNLTDYIELANALGFNQTISYDLATSVSRFNLTEESTTAEIMETSFGQGTTQITPLLNAMIVSAIANDGEMMQPMLVSSIVSASGKTVETREAKSLGTVMTKEEADILESMMLEVVNKGTATILKSSSYTAAAKTGSAQTGSDKETDAWLVAYIPYKDTHIVVSIVLEEAGAGSEEAGPIVNEIFKYFTE